MVQCLVLNRKEWSRRLIETYITKFIVDQNIFWIVLILDIVSLHREYILQLHGMLNITTIKIRELYIYYPHIDITHIEERLNIYGQCMYHTFSGRCRRITYKCQCHCYFHSKYIITPNITTIRLKLCTTTPLASSLITIVSNYIYGE
jgi:hypothetical protein